MKYNIIFIDANGFHLESFEDINDCNDRLTEVYEKYAMKENSTTEPIVIYGIVANYDKKITVECAVMGD